VTYRAVANQIVAAKLEELGFDKEMRSGQLGAYARYMGADPKMQAVADFADEIGVTGQGLNVNTIKAVAKSRINMAAQEWMAN
jgi:hypothetical protein